MRSLIYRFLKWIEKFTHTDMIYLTKNGSWISSSNFVTALLGILSAIAFANLLPQELYGLYKYLFSIFGILSLIKLTDLGVAYTHSVIRGNEGDLYKVFKIKTKWGIVAALVSVCIAAYYELQGNQYFAIAFLLMALLLPLYGNFSLLQNLLSGRSNFKLGSIYSTIVQVISTTVLISILFFTDNVIILVLTSLLTVTGMRAILFFYTLRKSPPNTTTEADTISYGTKLSFINLPARVIGKLDNIVIWHFLGPQQLAVYLFAQLPVEQIRSFLQFVTPLATSKLANKSLEDIKKVVTKKAIRFGIIISFFALGYILIAPFAFQLLFPDYMESVLFSQIAAVGLLLFPKKLFGVSLSVKNKAREQLYVQILIPLARLTLLFTLTYLYGIMGAIIALILADLIHALAMYILMKKAT